MAIGLFLFWFLAEGQKESMPWPWRVCACVCVYVTLAHKHFNVRRITGVHFIFGISCPLGRTGLGLLMVVVKGHLRSAGVRVWNHWLLLFFGSYSFSSSETSSLLKNWHVVLDLDPRQVDFKKRQEIKNDILYNGGVLGFSVTKRVRLNCFFFIKETSRDRTKDLDQFNRLD